MLMAQRTQPKRRLESASSAEPALRILRPRDALELSPPCFLQIEMAAQLRVCSPAMALPRPFAFGRACLRPCGHRLGGADAEADEDRLDSIDASGLPADKVLPFSDWAAARFVRQPLGSPGAMSLLALQPVEKGVSAAQRRADRSWRVNARAVNP